MGWGFRYNVVLVTALAMHGDSAGEAAVLAELDNVAAPVQIPRL